MGGWGRELARVASRFENTVVGQFYGHTHQDEFIVFYEPEASARATNVAFISPSVATWTNLNPSYRIFTSDSNTHVRHGTPHFSHQIRPSSNSGIFIHFTFLPYLVNPGADFWDDTDGVDQLSQNTAPRLT